MDAEGISLDVLPPVVDGNGSRKERRGVVHVELQEGMVRAGHPGHGEPAVAGTDDDQLIEKAGDVLAGGDAGDGPGEDVVEHQRGDAELGEGATKCFFHHAVDAAAREHGAALDIDRTHGEGEEHDAEDEPGCGLTYGLLGDAAGIKG